MRAIRGIAALALAGCAALLVWHTSVPGESPASTESSPPPSTPPAAQARGRLPVEDDQWTTRFDDHFRKYSKRFFSVAFDWRWFKAQGITESGLRADATSWVGARGIMQIMPATFEEIAELSSLPIRDTEDPAQNIAAGVFYDRRLYDLWSDIPDRRQRLAFAFASYNGGRSRTLRAQDRCPSECAQWPNVQAYVPEETRNYVMKIMRLMAADL